MKIKNNLPFSYLTHLPLKGHFSKVFMPNSLKELIHLLKQFEESNEKYFLWGKGTNTLPISSVVKTPVVVWNEKIMFMNDRQFIVSGNIQSSYIGSILWNSGFENYLGVETIPGTVGAGIKNNATFRGHNFYNGLKNVLIYNSGKTEFIKVDDINLSYRSTDICGIVLLAFYEPIPITDDSISLRKELFNYRKKQPQGVSLGSTFKNPEVFKAYTLVQGVEKDLDYCGVRYSSQHHNFLSFEKKVEPEVVYKLIKNTIEKVKEKYGVSLEPELVFIE